MRKAKDFYNKIDKNFLSEHLLVQKKSINALGREFDLTKEFIRTKCKEYQIPTDTHALKPRNITKEELEKLHFTEHKTAKQIAEIYDCTPRAIKHLFKKYALVGIDNRKEQNKLKHTNILTKEILDYEYTKLGLSKIEIQKKYQVGQDRLDTLFNEHEIDLINSRNKSSGENDVANWLTSVGEAVILHERNLLNPQELDIYLLEKKLAIEYNGIYWHSTRLLEKKYHLEKTIKCEKAGVQLLHIYDIEWETKQDIWKSIILSKLGKATKIFARKCTIKLVQSKDANEFCSKNHLSGVSHSKANIGLYYDNELVSLMTFAKPRFNKKHEWEILRFCNKLNTQVVGGASKLFSHFVKEYNPNSIITYANRRYSDGNLYEKLGFAKIGESTPNYFYTLGKNLMSRMAFQKHKLSEKLTEYDATKTEEENMRINGYYRIYDCGNLIYSWTK